MKHAATRMFVLLTVGFVAVVPTLASPTVAFAGPLSTCSYDGTTKTVTTDVAAGESVTIRRADDAITLDGVACGAATVVNTDLVSIVAAHPDATELVEISLFGGPLFPGATPEDDGSSDIEFEIDFKDGFGDRLDIVGSSDDDTISVGSHALGLGTVNLNADEAVFDADVTVSKPFVLLEVWGLRGRDRLSLWGPDGFATFEQSKLHGGPDGDRLLGVIQGEEEHLDGGTGTDAIDYAQAPDGFAGDLQLNWDGIDSTIGERGGAEDPLTSIEVAYLGPDDDRVVYFGNATGETWGAGGHDLFIADALLGSGDPGHRILHGGVGADQIDVATDEDLVVDLDAKTLRGAWWASYGSIWAITTGSGDDTLVARQRRSLPFVLTEEGLDTLDLREAVRGILVAAAGVPPPDDGRVWLVTFTERVLGSPFPDVLRGDESPNILRGLGGDDVLRGREGDDLLFGGPGDDILRGGQGSDTCQGGLGNDDVSGCSP